MGVPPGHRCASAANAIAVGLLVCALLGAGLGLPPIGHAAAVPIAVIAHRNSTPATVDHAQLRAIFTGRENRWSGGATVIAFNFPNKHALRVQFDREVLHMGPAEVGRFWVDSLIRGGVRAPRSVGSESLMMMAVAKLKGAVGYVPQTALRGDVKVIATIVDGEVKAPK